MTEESYLDIYVKYFWTHQGSDSVVIIDEPVHFEAADSHRLRGGLRFVDRLATPGGTAFFPYIGGAYEHEFDGEANGKVYDYTIKAPSLKGGTGIGELGVTIKSFAGTGISLDFNLEGYLGVREGGGGSFAFIWDF